MRDLICDACERGPQPCFDGLCLSRLISGDVWEKIARLIADDEGVECPEPEDAF
jgi:hypothetical protein